MLVNITSGANPKQEPQLKLKTNTYREWYRERGDVYGIDPRKDGELRKFKETRHDKEICQTYHRFRDLSYGTGALFLCLLGTER